MLQADQLFEHSIEGRVGTDELGKHGVRLVAECWPYRPAGGPGSLLAYYFKITWFVKIGAENLVTCEAIGFPPFMRRRWCPYCQVSGDARSTTTNLIILRLSALNAMLQRPT